MKSLHRRLAFFLLVWAPFSALALTHIDPTVERLEDPFIQIDPASKFTVEDRLKKNVDFWIKIYTQYTTRQGLVHDAKYIDHVYEIIEFTDQKSNNSRFLKSIKKKWKEILLSVHKKQKTPEKMTEDEKHVFQLFRDINEPNKFLNASHRRRLRFQLGQKDAFLDGLRQSGRYLPMMEEVFRKEGLPVELTRLPFVESSFNVRARSKVGASGIWQFMRSTARLFIKVNDALDERNDPIQATEAAAKLLRLNFESLKSWPLAVTAYNHGRKGVMRAVRRVGSDELEDLVDEYRSRSFGFASSNFFSELLAAIEVQKNAEKYFGKVDLAQPFETVQVKIPDYIEIKALSHFLKVEMKTLQDLNPGLTEAVYSGKLLVPAGYQLQVPLLAELGKESSSQYFFESYEKIPNQYKYKTQLKNHERQTLKFERRGKSGKPKGKNGTRM